MDSSPCNRDPNQKEHNNQEMQCMSSSGDNSYTQLMVHPPGEEEQQNQVPIKKSHKCRNGCVLFYVMVCLTLLVLSAVHDPFRHSLFDSLASLSSLPLMLRYSLLVLIGFLTVVLGLPLSIFEIILGYCSSSFWEAIVIDIVVNLVSFSFCYNMARQCLREQMDALMASNIIINSFKKIVQKTPFSSIMLLRFMIVPVFIKNYGYPLLDVHVVYQLIGLLSSGTFYGSNRIYIGYQMKILQQRVEKGNESDYTRMILSLSFSILVFFYFCHRTRQVIKAIKEEQALNSQKKDLKMAKEESKSKDDQNINIQQMVQ